MEKQLKLLVLVLLCTGCATYKSKYSAGEGLYEKHATETLAHTFYLIGDAGLSPSNDLNPALKAFRDRLAVAGKNSTAIFLGDNIYPAGMPDRKDSTLAYQNARNNLVAQLKTLEGYKGEPIFIPGNHDWYNDGLEGLEREEKFVTRWLDDKGSFQPGNGCPIKEISINDQLLLILVDTEWYLTNWDKQPDMNDKCSIKSREKFMEELEDLIKDHRDKTTIIAMHHPMFSYGPHGGQFSFEQHLFPAGIPVPLPLLGSALPILRTATGASIEDMYNKRYTELKKRLVTLAQYSDKVILVSGHEHSLQYIVEENTPQIVSGSGANKGVTRLLNGSRFATGSMGYAILEVYTDGSSQLRFYGIPDSGAEKLLFTTQVLPPDRKQFVEKYSDDFPKKIKASVYTPEEVDKGGIYRAIWGERYRKYYGTKVTAPTVKLDTLFGGLEPIRKGGGHQSRSLRLRDKSGKEYVMRALRKSVELYLQAMAFKDQYILGEFEDTYTEDVLSDFYTGSHPYASFTVGTLADAVGIYHTNPVLYYVPKQRALQDFNEEFGNELYMIEEHAGDGHSDQKSFGFANKIISTDDMLEQLRNDEKYSVDTRMFLRARLFDMIIGDWDRHVDQWRWAEFKDKDKGTVSYRPVPRDRDMAYSNYGDGPLMGLATRIIPGLKIMEGFHEEIRNTKGFNSSPKTFVLDLSLLSGATLGEWEAEAAYLRSSLRPEVIDLAFEAFPEEVRDETIAEIKKILLARADRIEETAREYFGILNKFAVVTGTDKDDWFEINCLSKEAVEISAYRIIGGEKEKQFFSKVFTKGITKEVWVYGLDDTDRFVVKGDFRAAVKIRLIGGQNNDRYEVLGHNGNVEIYDFESKKNTFKETRGAGVHLLDDYDVNTYRPLEIRASSNQILPTLGYNPDDGFKLGVSDTYTYNGFRQNPFTQKHRVNAAYYFATNGFELGYEGEFANISENWNLALEARFTTPNFSINFFDFGNDTPNPDDSLDFDYNRVRLETLRFSPSLVWRGQLGAKFSAGLSYEAIEVEETQDRFINEYYQRTQAENSNSYIGADMEYSYQNADNKAYPTVGMGTSLKVGYRSNLDDGNRDFGYVVPSLSLNYKLVSDGRFVLATKWKGHFTLGNGYEFYQAASLGASDGLRGYRNQRFTGKTSYYQSTDLRYSLTRLKTGILPVSLGLFGGFDYGRVWFPGDASKTWHNSYGGGLFLNASDIMTATLALFASEDGMRFSFGLGFAF